MVAEEGNRNGALCATYIYIAAAMCQSQIVGTSSKWERDLPLRGCPFAHWDHHLLFHFVDFVFQVLAYRDRLIQLVVHLYLLGLDDCSLASFALDESIEHGLYDVADIRTFE